MSTRIPKAQRLKDQLIALPVEEFDTLLAWANALHDVRLELAKPTAPKRAKPTKPSENNEPRPEVTHGKS